MKILDAHNHFWNYNPVSHSWIDDAMKVIRKDFTADDLKTVFQQNNVAGTVAVQADQTEEETQFLLEIAGNNEIVKGVVGWLDLRAEDIDAKLATFSKNPYLKGIRHIVQGESFDFMDGEAFQNGISLLEKYNLTYDILVFPGHLPSAIRLVKKFPNIKFVVDHIAKPQIKDQVVGDWKELMEELATYPNVSCKISGMVTEADFNNWKPEDFTKYLDVVTNAFGVDRLLYGSDWPVCLVAAAYEEQLNLSLNYMKAKYNEQELEKIFYHNTKEFYNIN